tara:strand:- start:139 stop:378 length:240 start_codon:yes stop_codon:yes gene_type:complete
MWELNENWANNLRGSLETQDATIVKRKVEVDNTSSIKVQGRIRVGEVTTSVTPVAGDMRYNTSTNKFQGWNGSAWQDFN